MVFRRVETASERWKWHLSVQTESLTEQFVVDAALKMLSQAYPNVPFDSKWIYDQMPQGFGAPDDAVSSILIYATNGDKSWINEYAQDLVEMAILDAKNTYQSQKPQIHPAFPEVDSTDEFVRELKERQQATQQFNEGWLQDNQQASNPYGYWAEIRDDDIVITEGP